MVLGSDWDAVAQVPFTLPGDIRRRGQT